MQAGYKNNTSPSYRELNLDILSKKKTFVNDQELTMANLEFWTNDRENLPSSDSSSKKQTNLVEKVNLKPRIEKIERKNDKLAFDDTSAQVPLKYQTFSDFKVAENPPESKSNTGQDFFMKKKQAS